MRSDALVDRVRVGPVREADDNVRVLEPKAGVDVGRDLVVGFENVFDIDIDEIVEGVDMLLHETLHFEERGEQQPFILQSVGIGMGKVFYDVPRQP